MPVVLLSAVLFFAAGWAVTADAEDRIEMRPATRAEIWSHLSPEPRQMTTKNDGFAYRAGNSNGYKVSNGQICVKFSKGRVDCADVKTDGKKFRMITKDGTRSAF